MNRFVLHIILILFSHPLKSQGQNLVYNGSFEEYYSCPVSNDLNNGQLELIKGWWKPTMGTSDYFNRCNNGVVGIPDNFWGHQEAFHGDGYVGLVPIELYPTGAIVGYEYIQTKLKIPLKPCYEYHFSMFVSMADYSTHSIGKLGALFSIDTNFNNYVDWNIIDLPPQIINSTTPIGDTITWIKIEGSFFAKGGEKFLTIGYFSNDVANDSIFFQYLPALPGQFVPYYYIDSVSLYEMGNFSYEQCNYHIEFPNIFTPNNDGVNDVIDISDLDLLEFIKEVKILNRWGSVITVLDKNNPIWDGSNCSDGVYYYFFDYELGSIKKKQSGFIHLMR